MPRRRIQSFEFNDQPWVPAVLRDTIVESLSRTLRWGHIMDGLVQPLSTFLDRAGTRDVLDLGSGAGGPAAILTDAFRARGEHVHFRLTDLFPRPGAWRELVAARPEMLEIVEEPVDATRIPEQLSAGRARVVLNVLHHFPEHLARGVIQDAVRARAPLFIAEGFERTPLGFLPFAPLGLPALALSPILARDRHLSRALVAWATPVALLASIWDGFVSTLRVYTEGELRAMTDPSPGWTWTYGTYDFAPLGRGYFFYGLP